MVVHHKGRKKTTDAESGVAVGSVAQAAVMDKMEKKKSKEVALDFYRFQKREAQRNGKLNSSGKILKINKYFGCLICALVVLFVSCYQWIFAYF